MPRFKVAHIREQGVDLIIIPLTPEFGRKTPDDQQQAIDELQAHSNAADLAGTVVPVWDNGGRLHFIAPKNWHAFFRSISLSWVAANLNREIYW